MACDPNKSSRCGNCVTPSIGKKNNSTRHWILSLISFGVMVFILWGFTQANAHGDEVESGRESNVADEIKTETIGEDATTTVTPIVTSAAIADLSFMTLEELKEFDGVQSDLIYVAYDGLIYDVTSSSSFAEGEHYGHLAGQDLTQAMAAAPHGEDLFEGFEVVAQLEGQDITSVSSARKPIKIFGLTLTRFTAYLALIFFILNYATCIAMPWSKLFMPWKGKRPGKDEWDQKGHLRLMAIHRPFAWGFLTFGLLHATLAILQYVFNIVI